MIDWNFPDRSEYLHGCKHGHTRLAGCRLGCRDFTTTPVNQGPNGYGPIVATDEEYEASVRAGSPIRSAGAPA